MSKLRLGSPEKEQSDRVLDLGPRERRKPDQSNADQIAALAALQQEPPAAGILAGLGERQGKTRHSTTATLGNDNLRFGLDQPDEHETKGGALGDDDGKTSELSLTHRRQTDYADGRSDKLSIGARHDTLTEDGNWKPGTFTERHKGRRADVAEVAAQVSRSREVAPGVRDTVALGGGLQATGDLGGRDIQDSVHGALGQGGRGDRLQQQYTQDEVSIRPTVSGGYARERDLGGGVSAHAGVRGKAALGKGYGWGEGFAGVQGRHENPLDLGIPSHVGWNAGVTAGYAGARDELDFNDDYNQAYVGAQAGVELGLGGVALEAGVRTGGLTGEALVGHLGIRVGASIDDILDTFK